MPADRNSQGLIMRPLGQLVDVLNRVGVKLFQPPEDTIRGLDANTWYSPLQPIHPIAPEGTEPRGFQYWAGQNLLYTPRADAEYTAAQLKQLATYPLARICIENVKDTICRIPWEIQSRPQPGETRKEAKNRTTKDDLAKIAMLNQRFEYPDREHSWPEWVAPLLDDLLVIDAGSVLIRKTFKGDIAELQVLRGESIVRYIDANGWTPMPPQPAYAQNWWGVPLVNLSTDQLLYKPRSIVPRNTMSSQLYGMPPTEQLAPEIETGWERLKFILAYYTEGSTPGVIQVAPKGTPKNKVAEAMQILNSDLAGNLAARRQWRIVQGFQEPGKSEQIEFTKEPLLADAFDDLHIRKIAFGYKTSAQRLLRMMNRASAQAGQEAAEEEGTLAWLSWLKSVIDQLIRKFNVGNFEIVFDPGTELDPLKNMTMLSVGVSKTLLTPNEGRARLGEEAAPEPEANMLGVITAAGFVPLGVSAANAAAASGASVDEDGKTTAAGKPNGKPGAAVPAKKPADKDKGAQASAIGFRAVEPIPVTSGRGTVLIEHIDGGPGVPPLIIRSGTKEALEYLREGGEHVSHGVDERPGLDHVHCNNHSLFESSCTDCSRSVRRWAARAERVAVEKAKKVVPRKKHEIHPGRLTPRSILAKHDLERVMRNRFKDMDRKTRKELLKILEKVASGELQKARQFDSVQFNLSAADAKKILAVKVAKKDWSAEKGRETEPHVTVLFGLDGVTVAQVEEITRGTGEVEVELGNLVAFTPTAEYQPLVVELKSEKLVALHDALAKLPHTDTHPEYRPHINIGYLKPGAADGYAGKFALTGSKMTLTDLVFSGRDKTFTSLEKMALVKQADDEDKAVDAVLKQLAADWQKVADEAAEPLNDATLAGAELGGIQLEIDDEEMISSINTIAADWAADRAAELVGMRRTKDGRLVKNPDAKFAITDATRDKLRVIIRDIFAKERPTVAGIEARIAQAGIFSDERATVIARTEISRAQTQGNLTAWRESGVVKLVAWVLSADHDHDDECDDNADNSPYPVDEAPELPAHPNCMCSLVLSDEDTLGGEGGGAEEEE